MGIGNTRFQRKREGLEDSKETPAVRAPKNAQFHQSSGTPQRFSIKDGEENSLTVAGRLQFPLPLVSPTPSTIWNIPLAPVIKTKKTTK